MADTSDDGFGSCDVKFLCVGCEGQFGDCEGDNLYESGAVEEGLMNKEDTAR